MSALACVVVSLKLQAVIIFSDISVFEDLYTRKVKTYTVELQWLKHL